MSQTFKEFYLEELKPKFDIIEKRQKKLQNKLKRSFICTAIIVVFFMAWIFVSNKLSFDLIFLLTFISLLLIAFAQFFYKVPKNKKYNNYRKYYKKEIVERIVNYIHPHAIYHPDKLIAKRDFLASLMFSQKSFNYSGDDLVYGEIGQTPFWFSELDVYIETSLGTTTIHTFPSSKKKRIELFKGMFFIADFNKHVKYPILICPSRKKTRKDVFPKQSRVENFENPWFEKHFAVYCKDSLTARYVLTPDFMKRIAKLTSSTRTHISISIVKSYIYIAIPYSKELFEPPTKLPRKGYYPQAFEIYVFMKRCMQIVEQLDLNTRIWTKE